MAFKKSLLIAGAVSTIGLASLIGTTAASAQTGQDTLIDKIATKFNLSKDEVKQVFEDHKKEHQTEHQAKLSERLQQRVDNGEITAEQKTLIENKLKELDTAREAEHEELKNWAKENDIDMKYLHVGGPRGGNSNRLQDAVDNGEITAEQKTLIENKQVELKEKREAARDSIKQWADDNNLDLKDIMPQGSRRGHGGPNKMMHQ
jgi:polyhydroxyalkanoate synthesis regulator phasin